MDSQEKSTKMEVLKLEAKELKIKGAHLFKKEDELEAKIAEVRALNAENPVVEKEVVEPVRKVAPRMSVSSINEDSRTKLLARLEAENPEYTYKFQGSGTSDEVLRGKGFERTEHSLKNDIVVRTMKDSFEQYQAAKNDAQRKMMDSIDTEGSKIKSHKSRAKDPTN